LPGSAPFQKITGEVSSLERGLDLTRQMFQEIEETGGDTFGARSKRQELLYQQTLGLIGQLSNQGVISPGEAERLSGALVNPTDYASRMRGNETIQAPYKELYRQLAMAREQKIRELTAGMGGTPPIPPIGVPPIDTSTRPAPPPGFVPLGSN
jgi:hypothetical protein